MSDNQNKHIPTPSRPDTWVWSVGTKDIDCALQLDHKAGGVQFLKNFEATI